MTYLDSITPPDLTPTAVRDLFNATKHRQDIQTDLLNIQRDEIARLSHRLDMKDGEITALWRALEKLEGTLATINQLLNPNRQHIAWKDQHGRQRTDGASPFQADPE